MTASFRAAIVVTCLVLGWALATTCGENGHAEPDREPPRKGSVDPNSLGPDAQGESGSLDEEIEVSDFASSRK